MKRENIDTETPQVNPGYALFRIAKALITSKQHEDPAIRARAQHKISQWTTVFKGILNGTLNVGSRKPLKDVPGWATLEVVTGGFATGELLAGGQLLEHERALLNKISPESDSDARRILNGYYLTDEGLDHLQELLHSGCYDVVVPEEGALLVAAWLVQNERVDAARDLLEELGPFFSRLRFYPIPMKHPRRSGARVFLQNVQSTVNDIRKITPNQRILAQKEAIQIWIPLYDHMIELFLETVAGDPPILRHDPEGKRNPVGNGAFPVVGGWPCQNYPEGWRVRVQKTLDEYKRKRKAYTLCGKPDRSKGSFAQLRKYLSRCVKNPDSLCGRDVGRIRLLLARYITKRGTPNSLRCRKIREDQTRQASAPTFHEISRVVIQRLNAYPEDKGIDELDAITQPITGEEAELWKVEADTSVPASLQRKLQRCLCETIAVLVERRVITSGEMLARVLPQMTSGLRAAGITDPALRQLYAAIYRAFRRRRSLLLLNFESQIKIEELPWVAAIDRFRHDNLSTRELAKQTLEEVTVLTLTSFPQVIVPNKLLQELQALSTGAGLNLPLVDEVAADIFMGEFSEKFLLAAKRAADLLEGTLYEIYYGIDYRHVKQIPENKITKRSRFQHTTDDPFSLLCSSRAGVNFGWGDPASNGMIIEQQQILTSQNLAVLLDGLNLADVLHGQLYDLAQRCFMWICRRQQVKSYNWHARLIMLKNTAYAWRQMVFFLALLPGTQVQTFLAWADKHLNTQKEEFQIRFRPALHGLMLAAEGHSLADQPTMRPGARRFLGWSKKRHWVLEQ